MIVDAPKTKRVTNKVLCTSRVKLSRRHITCGDAGDNVLCMRSKRISCCDDRCPYSRNRSHHCQSTLSPRFGVGFCYLLICIQMRLCQAYSRTATSQIFKNPSYPYGAQQIMAGTTNFIDIYSQEGDIFGVELLHEPAALAAGQRMAIRGWRNSHSPSKLGWPSRMTEWEFAIRPPSQCLTFLHRAICICIQVFGVSFRHPSRHPSAWRFVSSSDGE